MELLNNGPKEKELKCLLEDFKKEYLIELLIYHGNVSKTLHKINWDFAPEGTIFLTTKKLLKKD